MIYQVCARFNYDKARAFFQKLTDGSIERQRPDGSEIVKSMHRATIDNDGAIRWTEMCFCPTPLQHERATVYDEFFYEMTTKVISSHQQFEGSSFMEKLKALAH